MYSSNNYHYNKMSGDMRSVTDLKIETNSSCCRVLHWLLFHDEEVHPALYTVAHLTETITIWDLSLSLSGACHEDVAASTSRRHAGLSIVRRRAIARPKLRGCRSSSTVLSQVCLSLPGLCRQSLGGPWMQAWRAREWSWPVLAWHRWSKKEKVPLTDSICQERLSRMWLNHIFGDKIRPMDMEDASETPIIQCIYLLL